MSDNAQETQGQPFPEELAIQKRKKFEENPDEFFHISELVIGVRKVNGGLQTMIGGKNRTELEAAVTKVQYEAFRLFDFIEVKKAKEQQSKIIKGNGGRIMNFVRGR